MCPLFLTTRGTAAVFSLVRYVNTVTLWIHETAVTLNNRTGIPLQFFFHFFFLLCEYLCVKDALRRTEGTNVYQCKQRTQKCFYKMFKSR